jgi:hypothetical protein
MSLGSRADIVPFTRFLDVRQRRQQIATATGTDLTPPPSDVRTPTESPNATIDEERAAPGPSREDSMNWKTLVVSLGVAVGFAAHVSTQAASANGNADHGAIHSIKSK